MKIVFIVIAILIILFSAMLWQRNSAYVERFDVLEQRLTSSKDITEVFSRPMVDSLPQPAALFLQTVINEGTPLAAGVSLRMSGEIKISPGSEWNSFEAQQHIRLDQGFIRRTYISVNPFIKIKGAEWYVDNQAQIYFSLFHLIPLLNATGEQVVHSQLGRLIFDYIWLPSALLPQNNIHWEFLKPDTLRATTEKDSITLTLNFIQDEDGLIEKVSLNRLHPMGDETSEERPYGGYLSRYMLFEGYLIPTEVRAGWNFGTDDYEEHIRLKISDAVFF